MLFKPLLGNQLSGSVGGITASHNRGGAYFRSRSVPTQPNTTRQMTMRAALASLVNAWNSALSDTQRTAWNTYAASVSVINRIGESIFLTGQQMYIRCNGPRVQAANSGLSVTIARVDDAPVIFNTGEVIVSPATVEQTVGVLDWQFNISPGASAAGVALLYFGRPLNDGAVFSKGPYQLAAAAAFLSAADLAEFTPDTSDASQWQADIVPAAAVRYPVALRLAFADGRLSLLYRDVIESEEVI